MRSLLVVVVIIALSTPLMFSQDPARDAERAKIDSMNQRNRGRTIPGSEGDQLQTGRLVDVSQVQQKTDELNQLVKSLNADMANLHKGMLPADMNQKLKRIEKLAKEIRHTLE